MKKIIILALCLVVSSLAVERLKVKKDETPIYKSKTGDASRGALSAGTIVMQVKKGKNRTRVKTPDGKKGWVVNSDMVYTKSSKGDAYTLDEVDITGWLDNPSAVYILDGSGDASSDLPLTRNFEDEIFEGQDRERIERGNDEN